MGHSNVKLCDPTCGKGAKTSIILHEQYLRHWGRWQQIKARIHRTRNCLHRSAQRLSSTTSRFVTDMNGVCYRVSGGGRTRFQFVCSGDGCSLCKARATMEQWQRNLSPEVIFLLRPVGILYISANGSDWRGSDRRCLGVDPGVCPANVIVPLELEDPRRETYKGKRGARHFP